MNVDYGTIKGQLRQRVQERLDFRRDFSDEEVADIIDEALVDMPGIEVMTIAMRQRLKQETFDSLRRLDILQSFVEDASVTEIMINGKDHVFIERAGRLLQIKEQFETQEKLEDVIQQIVAGCNRVVNEASPIVDARLANGARVNIVMPPIALNGPIVTIRRFPEQPITMGGLIGMESITSEAAEFLKTLVKAKYNIFISGANRIIGLSQMTFRKQRVQTT